MRNRGKAALHSILAPLLACSSPCLAQDGTPAPGSADTADAPASGWGEPLIGRLANGLRFAILPRQGREPGVALLMRNEGGFIAERRPGERGLAHLIEHVVFRSPTTGSPDDRDHFTRMGLQWTLPSPQVATTSWRESNFFLSSKTNEVGQLGNILGLLREAATDLTFRADAVDEERVSVMEEMADKTHGNTIYADYIAAIAPGSPNDLIDAQNSDDVPTASVETIRALYRRLYRPENMMIVIVGNVKPDEMRALIDDHFADWTRSDPAAPTAPFPMFERDRIRPISVSALPQGRRAALMTVVLPTPAPPSSRDHQAKDDLMDLIVARAINMRLAALQPDGPAGKVGMLIDNGEQGQRQILLWDHFADGLWRPAVAGLRRVTCDLTRSGFTTAEWNAAKHEVTADLARRAADMPNVANVDLAKDLSHAIADGRDLIPPDEMLRYAQAAFPGMDARAGAMWWRRQWIGGVEHLRVEAPELADVDDPVTAVQEAADDATDSPGCKVR